MSSYPVANANGVDSMGAVVATLVRLLTPQQLADMTGLSVSTLAKLRLTSEGCPFRKLGGSVRYSEDDAIEWINAHPRRRSTSDNGSALTERKTA